MTPIERAESLMAAWRNKTMWSEEMVTMMARAIEEAEIEGEMRGEVKGMKEEREACAQILDEEEKYYRGMIPNMNGDSIVWHHGAAKAAAHLARKIRARSG